MATLDDIVVEAVDICSSGHDVTDDWHKLVLKGLFTKVAPNDRAALLQLILDHANDSEGWELAELRMIQELLGVPNRIIFAIDKE